MLLDNEDVGMFPDQIISEILMRLPAKSVCRFKCVSKRWFSLICSPHFITSYISHSSPSWAIVDRAIPVNPGLIGPQLSLTLREQSPHVSFLAISRQLVDLDLYYPPIANVPVVISVSNCGLVLVALPRKRDPDGLDFRTQKDSLVVCNPITHQHFVLPGPPDLINNRNAIGFACRDSSFVVVEYGPIIGTESAFVMIFSSQSGRWEKRDANYMLDMHFWRAQVVLEFDGHLIWVELSRGLIVWDEPFSTEKKVHFRFIPFPKGCQRPFSWDLVNQRTVGVGAGCVQYLEMVNENEQVLKLWRLNDYQGGEWGLLHQVKLKDIWADPSYLAFRLPTATPVVSLIHPFEPDVAFFVVRKSIFEVHLGNKTVLSCGDDYSFCSLVMPYVIPRWPASFAPFFFAVSAKERGNEHFKAKDFKEAIAYYSRSICHSPSAAAYANRAAAYLKIGDYLNAENDCTDAIKLDGEYLKAYARQATARIQLGKIEEAKEDAERCLKMDPWDDAVLKLQAEINSLMEKVVIKDDPADAVVPGNDK